MSTTLPYVECPNCRYFNWPENRTCRACSRPLVPVAYEPDTFFDDVAPEDQPLPTVVSLEAKAADRAALEAYRATHAAALPDGFFDDVAPEDQPLPTVVELGLYGHRPLKPPSTPEDDALGREAVLATWRQAPIRPKSAVNVVYCAAHAPADAEPVAVPAHHDPLDLRCVECGIASWETV